jgi:hypothetical protein
MKTAFALLRRHILGEEDRAKKGIQTDGGVKTCPICV